MEDGKVTGPIEGATCLNLGRSSDDFWPKIKYHLKRAYTFL